MPSRLEKSARRAWAAVQDAAEELHPSELAEIIAARNFDRGGPLSKALAAALRATLRETLDRLRLARTAQEDAREDGGPDEDDLEANSDGNK
jgi:hypothetical protein